MGFDGLVVSDYGAIGNLHTVQRVAPIPAACRPARPAAGMDVEQHVPEGFDRELRDWFAHGRADMALLDQAVLRVLTAKFRMGLFDHPFAPRPRGARRPFGGAGRQGSRCAGRARVDRPPAQRRRLPAAPGPAARRDRLPRGDARFFFGGYTHFSMAEGKLAANASMAGLAGAARPEDHRRTPSPAPRSRPTDDPRSRSCCSRQQPGIRTLLTSCAHRMPDTEVIWARGYPIAGDDSSGHARGLCAGAQRADVVLLTLGGKHGTSSIASMGEGIDATDINLPPCQDI